MGQIKKYWVDKATGKYLTKNIDGQDHLLYKWVDGEPEIVYGALYNWYAVINENNIASEGWRVPSNWDTYDLLVYLTGGGPGSLDVFGGKLKETGLTYWNSPNTGATNEVGFNSRGSGYRINTNGSFAAMKDAVAYLLSNSYSSSEMLCMEHTYNSGYGTYGSIRNKKEGHPVRLIKDSTTLSHGEEGEYVGNDGKKYQTICIGTQEWVAENLIETKYRNGDDIAIVEDDIDWSNLTTGAMCYYDNDINNAYV